MASEFVQITPAYPPSLSGVGDYASALATRGAADGIRLSTIVASPCLPLADIESVFHSDSCERHLSQLLSQLRTHNIVLHFSGYGYARWGICYWLSKCLYNWKRDDSRRRLVVIYHEVFASGPIWKSSFWSAPFQRDIAKKLADLAHRRYVTSVGGRNQLMHACDVTSVNLLPVFSTVGEPLHVKPLAMRGASAVVFGAPATRNRFYSSIRNSQSLLQAAFDRLGIDQVLDVGFSLAVPESLAGRPVRAFGALEPQQISALLSEARIALIDYSFLFIDKSTVAAAYLAHGCLLVNASKQGLGSSFPSGYRTVCATPEQILDEDFDPETFAASGYSLYQRQRSGVILRELLTSFDGVYR